MKFVSQYAIAILLALLVAAVGVAGVQTLRYSWLETSIAEAKTEATEKALSQYVSLATGLDTVASQLVVVQKERDDARKKIGKRVVEYVTRPGSDVQCLDDDGLRIVQDIARGKASNPGASASEVSR